VRPEVTWTDDETRDGLRHRRLTFTTGDGDAVPALLLEPVTGRQTRVPGILALHQTTPVGKLEPAGLAGSPDLAYGLELARRGYAVLMPDVFAAGERVPSPGEYDSSVFDAAHPEWSAVGKMLFDHRHAVTVLASLPSVDPARIGAIGHSLGGYNAWVLHGADARVKVAVCSCGYSCFAGDPRPDQWCRQPFPYLPRLRPWLARDEVPYEANELVALGAPKPLFYWVTKQDVDDSPHWPEVLASLGRVQDLYERLSGDRSRLVVEVGEGGHAFPREARIAAYAFIDRWLWTTPTAAHAAVDVAVPVVDPDEAGPFDEA